MPTTMSEAEFLQITEDDGFAVYARVDERTLSILDRCSDERILPRSWVIAEILRDWAGQYDEDCRVVL